jgi:hypothetical protein
LPGNCGKDEVAAWARAMHPLNYLFDQNACDAYCIAYATRSVIEPAPQDDSQAPLTIGG